MAVSWLDSCSPCPLPGRCRKWCPPRSTLVSPPPPALTPPLRGPVWNTPSVLKAGEQAGARSATGLSAGEHSAWGPALAPLTPIPDPARTVRLPTLLPPLGSSTKVPADPPPGVPPGAPPMLRCQPVPYFPGRRPGPNAVGCFPQEGGQAAQPRGPRLRRPQPGAQTCRGGSSSAPISLPGGASELEAPGGRESPGQPDLRISVRLRLSLWAAREQGVRRRAVLPGPCPLVTAPPFVRPRRAPLLSTPPATPKPPDPDDRTAPGPPAGLPGLSRELKPEHASLPDPPRLPACRTRYSAPRSTVHGTPHWGCTLHPRPQDGPPARAGACSPSPRGSPWLP